MISNGVRQSCPKHAICRFRIGVVTYSGEVTGITSFSFLEAPLRLTRLKSLAQQQEMLTPESRRLNPSITRGCFHMFHFCP